MVREGYIDPSRHAAPSRKPAHAWPKHEWRPAPERIVRVGCGARAVDSVLGVTRSRSGDVIVYTTIDGNAQKAAERAVAKRAAYIQRARARMVRADQWRRCRARSSRSIRAPATFAPSSAGGRYERGGFNRAISARRQPGSAFKPFVYAAALAAGITPATMVDDEPVEIVGADGRIWTPRQLRRRVLRAHDAASSAHAHRRTRRPCASAVRWASSAWWRRPASNGIRVARCRCPAIALGAVEVTPLELVAAYAPFANGGYAGETAARAPHRASDGRVLWKTEAVRRSGHGPARRLSADVNAALGRRPRHGARRARLGRTGPMAGKTGTTNDGADVWFVGYTPTLVAAAFWFGHDSACHFRDDVSGGQRGRPGVGRVLHRWMARARDGRRVGASARHGRAADRSETGELAGEWCPATQTEWFKPGTEPTEHCREHLEPERHVGRRCRASGSRRRSRRSSGSIRCRGTE